MSRSKPLFPQQLEEDVEKYEKELLSNYTLSDNEVVQEMNSASEDQLSSGSSHTRPKILYSFAKGLGTDYDEEKLIKLASLVQFHHEGSLKLDDKHDGDETRRGENSYPEKMKETSSNSAGELTDSQVIKETVIPYMELDRLDIPNEHSVRYREILGNALINLAEGQAQDNVAEDSFEALNLEEDYSSESEWYSHMVDQKTGALIDAPAEIGAIAGEGDSEKALEWSKLVGRMYQIQDDVLDNLEDEKKEMMGKTPKDRFSDIHEDKESYFWQVAEKVDDTGTVEHVREKDNKTDKMVEKAWEEAKNSGALEQIDDETSEMEEKAIEALNEMEWENEEYRGHLEELTSKLRKPIELARTT